MRMGQLPPGYAKTNLEKLLGDEFALAQGSSCRKLVHLLTCRDLLLTYWLSPIPSPLVAISLD